MREVNLNVDYGTEAVSENKDLDGQDKEKK